jgi:hypothetical protein
MNSEQIKDIHLLYNAVYNEELREQFDEYNNTIYDEDIVEVATEYFYSYGLNEDGIDILIEKVGLESFVEYVYDLSEDLHVLTEARARKKYSGPSYDEVKAGIDAREAKAKAKKEAKKKASEAASEKKETERKEPESRGVESQAKAEQPKSKKPIRDAIARQILAGMKRHREATQTAGNLARETGKTLGKIASVTHEAGRRAGEHVKKHGLKSLANEEFDNFDIILEYLISEGYADTNENALAIMSNMSEEWRENIFELHKGRHGQSETEYMAGRSDAGKRISGDSETGPRYYTLGRSRGVTPDEPTKPGKKPKNTPKLAQWEKDDIKYRKANLKKR